MKRTTWIVAACATLLCFGCGLFATDVKSALAAADGMLASHRSTYDGVRKLLDHPKVQADAALKAAILAELKADFDTTSRLHRILVRWLDEVGVGVDWQARATELLDLYDKMRAER